MEFNYVYYLLTQIQNTSTSAFSQSESASKHRYVRDLAPSSDNVRHTRAALAFRFLIVALEPFI